MRLIILTVLLVGCVGGIPTAEALEIDKEKHLVAGIMIGTVSPAWGCVIGAAKEVDDKFNNGTVEFQDFMYTCAGSLMAKAVGRDEPFMYRAAASSILLDGISTVSALHRDPNAREDGPIMKVLFGERPTDVQVIIATGLNLALLEFIERADASRLSKDIIEATIIWTRYRVIKVNFEIARW